jgi:nucleoside-diphosphate-sugar epimerase
MFTFNFVSSWFVYGDVPLPAKETECCNPKGFYSISKRAAEQYLISYCETYGIHYRILRLANVIGVEDDGVSEKKNALQYLIRKFVNGESIKLYNGGKFIRDYINVRDACLAIFTVLTKGEVDDIYNISNGTVIVFRELIDMAVKEYGDTVLIEDMPPSSFHKVVQVANMRLDNTKLKELGYRPRISMETTIRQIVNYYNEHRQN